MARPRAREGGIVKREATPCSTCGEAMSDVILADGSYGRYCEPCMRRTIEAQNVREENHRQATPMLTRAAFWDAAMLAALPAAFAQVKRDDRYADSDVQDAAGLAAALADEALSIREKAQRLAGALAKEHGE